MADKLYNLDLFSQEILFFVSELLFNYLLGSNDLAGIFILALKNSGKLSFSKLWSPNKLLIKGHIGRLHPELSDPVLDDLLVFMVENPGPYHLGLMRYAESMA
jgi:hypothetical protein